MTLPATVPLKNGGVGVIRSAEPRDASEWIANANEVGGERVHLMSERFTRTATEIESQFRDANPKAELWLVAVVEGAVVGGGNFLRGKWAKNAHTASLGVSVRRAFRGLGLGEAIMRAGIEWAQGLGIRKLTLGVFATNGPALALYQKLGFVEEGRLRGEVLLQGVPVDEILMARWL